MRNRDNPPSKDEEQSYQKQEMKRVTTWLGQRKDVVSVRHQADDSHKNLRVTVKVGEETIGVGVMVVHDGLEMQEFLLGILADAYPKWTGSRLLVLQFFLWKNRIILLRSDSNKIKADFEEQLSMMVNPAARGIFCRVLQEVETELTE